MVKINNKGKFLGPFYCILAAVVWGLSFVAQSEGADIGTFTFNGIRTLIGGIVLVPLVLIGHISENKKLPSGEKKKFAFKDVLIGGICCGVVLCVASSLQQFGVSMTTAGKAGFITGENICIDGGMTRQMIYHGDCGWRLEK